GAVAREGVAALGLAGDRAAGGDDRDPRQVLGRGRARRGCEQDTRRERDGGEGGEGTRPWVSRVHEAPRVCGRARRPVDTRSQRGVSPPLRSRVNDVSGSRTVGRGWGARVTYCGPPPPRREMDAPV